MNATLFHLQTLSALHCGTGQSVGVVDLPIARARATQLPIVPGSSLRGVLRQTLEAHDEALAQHLFGPRQITRASTSFGGAMTIGDAHLLTLPIRALAGISCNVTSPYILTRYARDLRSAGIATPAIPTPEETSSALVSGQSVNLLDERLILEELDLTVQTGDAVDHWARWIAEQAYPGDATAQQDFICRFAVVPDAIMGFLSETAMELRTRISIDEETGTVKRGALWFEEHLPAESVLWGVCSLGRSRAPGPDAPSADALAGSLSDRLPMHDGLLLQLGGQAGVGRGLVRLRLLQETAQ